VGALIIRFCTLWFGVIVGLVALVLVGRLLARKNLEAQDISKTERLGGEGAPASS
jgi:hypothetical protein